MRAVFEAICHRNPYPRDHFDEHRLEPHGAQGAVRRDDPRARSSASTRAPNPELARILRDYAHERWAAERPVSPELWRCVGPFATDAAALADLERALGGSPAEASAAALALHASPSPDAPGLLAARGALAARVAAGTLTWNTLPDAEG